VGTAHTPFPFIHVLLSFLPGFLTAIFSLLFPLVFCIFLRGEAYGTPSFTLSTALPRIRSSFQFFRKAFFSFALTRIQTNPCITCFGTIIDQEVIDGIRRDPAIDGGFAFFFLSMTQPLTIHIPTYLLLL